MIHKWLYSKRPLVCVAFLLLVMNSFAQVSSTPATQNEPAYKVEIVPAMNGTWCFVIRLDEKRIIHQSQLPGQPSDGYKSTQEAETAAKEAIEQIRRGAFPTLRPIERAVRVKQKS